MNILKFTIVLAIAFTSQAWSAGQPKLSDFIMSPAPEMQPIPEMEGAWFWNKPGVEFEKYDKILLDDIEIFLAADSKYTGINASQMKALTDSMRAVMIEALEPDYPVVSKTGPGVLVARIAITNVYLGKPKHRLGQYTPIGLLASGIKKIAGKPKNFSIKNASVEAQMIDLEIGELIAVRTDTTPLRGLDEDPEELTWESIEEALQVYAKRFRGRVEHVRGM
jgi:hypothetical protein